MLSTIKSFFEYRIFGLDPNKGEPIDLSTGRLRVKSTCEPEKTLDFNQFWQHVYEENRKITLGQPREK